MKAKLLKEIEEVTENIISKNQDIIEEQICIEETLKARSHRKRHCMATSDVSFYRGDQQYGDVTWDAISL